MYLLDTNACIRILNDSSEPLIARMHSESPLNIRLSSITKGELIFGARRSARPAANLRLLAKFFSSFISLPFEDDSADHYGRIRAELTVSGRPIGPNDLLIAAIALAHDLTLVTHNTREFSRVVGLRLEDWEA